MLSNAYFLAKFRFDTAENEPAKDLQNFANFANFAPSLSPYPLYPLAERRAAGGAPSARRGAAARRRGRAERPRGAALLGPAPSPGSGILYPALTLC